MRLITIASLGASAALGLAALFVAKVALPAAGAQSDTAEPAARGVPVVVAAQAIDYGARLEARHLEVVRLPAAAAPAGAFATVEQVLAQDGGGAPVALAPIAAREALLPTRLSGPGARPTIAAEIAPGLRAYTIRVSDVSGVGGHALPGDRVDVVLMRDLSTDPKDRNLVSEVVIQNVRVLGVDLNADPTSTKPLAPKTATLEVSVQDAQKLAMAMDLGVLSLALRRTGASELEAAAPVSTGDFVLAGARAPAPRAAGPARPRTAPRPPILVVEGDGAPPRGLAGAGV